MQFQYDNLNQLQVADHDLASLQGADIGVGAGNETVYDANGNILEITLGGTTKTYTYYPGTNKVQNTDGSGNDYTYDANGNIIISTPKNLSSLNYDPFTQMTNQITTNGNEQIGFGYGGGNQRVLKTLDDQTNIANTMYLHGMNDYPLMEKTKANPAPETRVIYIYGPTGLLAMQREGEVYYVLKDHLGSTRVVVDETGTVAAYFDYAPFGKLMRSGVNTDIAYRYTGQEFDAESGLHNFRARLYDDELLRFYAMDPAGQFASPYMAMGNNPILFVDKDGRIAWWIPVLIGAYIGGAAANDHLNPLKWDYGSSETWIGMGIGAAAGAFAYSGIVAGGAYGTAVGSSFMNVGVGLLEGNRGWELLGYAGVGFATGYFGARGGFGLVGKKQDALFRRVWGRLATQILTTSARSIGNNWAAGRDPFHSFMVGFGPVNLRFGKHHTWRNALNIKDNWFNVISNGIGMFTHVSSLIDSRFEKGSLEWDWNSLSLNYKNQVLDDFLGGIAMGPYSIWNSSALDLIEEGNHVWQSRIFGELFLPTYFWNSFIPWLNGGDPYLENFFEIQAKYLW